MVSSSSRARSRVRARRDKPPFRPNGTGGVLFSQELLAIPDFETTVNSAYAALDAKFNTGSVSHKLTIGFFGSGDFASEPISHSLLTIVPGCNFNDMAACRSAALTAYGSAARLPYGSPLPFGNITYLNAVIGDQIKFNQWLSGVAGVNYATIVEQDYSGGVPADRFTKSVPTPSASLIVTPIQNLSFYATYMQGLEEGGFAGPIFEGLPVTNPGAAPPAVDQEYEVGAKWEFGGLLTTLSLFDLTKAATVYVPNARRNGRDVRPWRS